MLQMLAAISARWWSFPAAGRILSGGGSPPAGGSPSFGESFSAGVQFRASSPKFYWYQQMSGGVGEQSRVLRRSLDCER